MSVAFCPEQSSAMAKSALASAGAEQRREQLIRVADLGDVLVAGAVKRRGGHHQDGGVDEEGEHQRDGRIDRCEVDRLALVRDRVAVLARLHDRGMQIQIVRHHRRAEDADRDVEHVRCRAGSRRAGRTRRATPPRSGRARAELDGERAGDGENQADDERFDVAEAAVLQEQDDEHVERGEDDSPDERQMKEQVERDRGADHFSEVACGDGDLAERSRERSWSAGSRCRGRPARDRARWRSRGARRAPAAGSP